MLLLLLLNMMHNHQYRFFKLVYYADEDNLGLGRLNWIGKESSATPTRTNAMKKTTNFQMSSLSFLICALSLLCKRCKSHIFYISIKLFTHGAINALYKRG